MQEVLINRVTNSGIITINLEDFFPSNEFITFDLKDFLFHGLILKEKEFRTALKELDWTAYENKIVLLQCLTDAIIPMWAYMLVSQHLAGVSYDLYQGGKEDYIKMHYRVVLSKEDWKQYSDQRIVVKGCGSKPVPEEAYALVTRFLQPFAQSIMFGEPCSTVPIFKRPRVIN